MLQEKGSKLTFCISLHTGQQRPAPCLGAKNTKLSLDRLLKFVPKICPGEMAESTLGEGRRETRGIASLQRGGHAAGRVLVLERLTSVVASCLSEMRHRHTSDS